MIDATLISERIYNTAQKVFAHRYTFPSVNDDATGEEVRFVDLEGNQGKLVGFRIMNASSDFSISIRSKKEITPPDMDEIYKVTGIDKEYTEMDLHIFFTNMDSAEEKYLYAVLINASGGGDTGLNTIELLIARM